MRYRHVRARAAPGWPTRWTAVRRPDVDLDLVPAEAQRVAVGQPILADRPAAHGRAVGAAQVADDRAARVADDLGVVARETRESAITRSLSSA